MNVTYCRVCGGSHFQFQPVLWPKLIADWQLSSSEVEYINRQQGKCCTSCGANLRSIALATSLCNYFSEWTQRSGQMPGPQSLLKDWVNSPALQTLALLEINEAGTLSACLSQLPGRHFGSYPALDMCKLALPDACVDVVVHSDTLEHIQYPVLALEECRRILKPGGVLCMTVPIVVGRLSRNRDGLAASHHSPHDAPDYTVHTEFGADAWTYLMIAGFSEISMNCVEYPSAISFTARKNL